MFSRKVDTKPYKNEKIYFDRVGDTYGRANGYRPAAGRTVSQRSEAGRTTEKTFYSKVFGTDRAYSIYLPRDYETNPNKSYPIFYLLHGASDDNRCYENKAGLSSIANQLTASGEAIGMIIVTPNAGGTEYEGYYNMDGDKYPYEQFFFDEFMPYIESNYRVKPGKENRAIGGLSMGGGGCVWYALTRPDLFCAVYEMSGALGIDESSSLWNPRNELAAKKKASYLEHICSERKPPPRPRRLRRTKRFCGTPIVVTTISLSTITGIFSRP